MNANNFGAQIVSCQRELSPGPALRIASNIRLHAFAAWWLQVCLKGRDGETLSGIPGPPASCGTVWAHVTVGQAERSGHKPADGVRNERCHSTSSICVVHVA